MAPLHIYSGAPMPYLQRITCRAWRCTPRAAGLSGLARLHPAADEFRHAAVGLDPARRAGDRDAGRGVAGRCQPCPPDRAPGRAGKEAAAAPPPPAQPEKLELRLTSLTAHDDERVQTADASGAVPSPPTADAAPEVAKDAAQDAPPPLEGAAGFIGPVKPRRGHVAAFVSRKDGKLYVRQNFEPLFEAPVAIAAPERPLGTHVFTARADAGDANALRWSVVSLPVPVRVADRDDGRTRRGRAAATVTDATPPLPPSTAAEALDRLAIPDDAMARIAAALEPGGSLVVSDHGLGDETGRGTDFIVPLR